MQCCLGASGTAYIPASTGDAAPTCPVLPCSSAVGQACSTGVIGTRPSCQQINGNVQQLQCCTGDGGTIGFHGDGTYPISCGGFNPGPGEDGAPCAQSSDCLSGNCHAGTCLGS